MDRARRAEPYSNATIWTREIARNLAGHLDRLSKVHSCVDSASPKHSMHIKHSGPPHKRVGQVSPLKYDRSASAAQRTPTEDGDDPIAGRQDDSYGSEGSATARELRTPTKRRRVKTLKTLKTVPKHLPLDDDSLSHENQQLPEPTDTPSSRTDQIESLPMPAHAKKAAPVDYHRRQEQQRILQENQALAKRLRDTKPTLRSKDWEKDDKWNQSYLKTQERRRQALQHEMQRTLASPHSALIRVKHAVPSSSQASGRPQTEFAFDNDASPVVTTIEVTTHDAKASGRHLRRRRSADEEITKEQRYQSTAPNHRRILELRKQRERRGNDGSDGPTTGTGPPDELVSVRFTFSREGNRGLCTPNGITGQFSPAVELEAALETSCCDDDALLVPVPALEPPNTSRLGVEEEDVNADPSGEVYEALQTCIDTVVSIAEQEPELDADEPMVPMENTHMVNEPLAPVENTSLRLDDAVATELGLDEKESPPQPVAANAEAIRESDPMALVENQQPDEPGVTVPEQHQEEPLPGEETAVAEDTVAIDEPLQDSTSVERTDLESDPQQLQVAALEAEDADLAFLSGGQESPSRALDASGYGSEFDAEESTPKALEPTVAVLMEEPNDDDAYDDEDHDHETREDAEEPQYDDDLEPESARGAENDEYGDEGFADD